MQGQIRVGFIGMDTGHVLRLAELMNDPANPHRVPGMQAAIATKDGMLGDFFNNDKVPEYERTLANQYGLALTETAEEVAKRCDALILGSIDARAHPAQLRKIAAWRKPVFVGKPLAASLADAEAMLELAQQEGMPLMSCSPLRYADSFVEAVSLAREEGLLGCDCGGPLELQPQLPGWYWYGVHQAELLIAAMGPDWRSVRVKRGGGQEWLQAEWEDGTMATARGNPPGNPHFTAVLHSVRETRFVAVREQRRSYFASLAAEIAAFFRSRISPVPPEEMLSVIRFVEAANASRRDASRVFRRT